MYNKPSLSTVAEGRTNFLQSEKTVFIIFSCVFKTVLDLFLHVHDLHDPI